MNRPAREAGLLWPARWRLALAGAVFVLVYSWCNRFTASRSDVGIAMWEWEKHIPFVRELVVPYWSLDLFFCGVFFLCRTKAELNLLTKRLIAITVASGICYLIFPLKMGLPRPVPEGWTAPFFKALYFNDLPHNLAPSLHIGLRSLVWVFYGAHLTGWLRKATKVWFILIGASTLLVWQHHFIDVASGFIMGWFIAAIIPDQRIHTTRNPSPKLAARYGAGSVVCTVLAYFWMGFAWPAFALSIVALAYATGLPRLLGKENGTLSPSAEWCLLPVLLVAYLIQRRWLNRLPAWREITPGVLFGRKLSATEATALVAEGPLAVLDLTAESNAQTVFREHALYCNLPLLDLVPPCEADIAAALAFIRNHQKQCRIFMHCQLGLQRSAIIAAHWLVSCGEASNIEQARQKICAMEPAVMF